MMKVSNSIFEVGDVFEHLGLRVAEKDRDPEDRSTWSQTAPGSFPRRQIVVMGVSVTGYLALRLEVTEEEGGETRADIVSCDYMAALQMLSEQIWVPVEV